MNRDMDHFAETLFSHAEYRNRLGTVAQAIVDYSPVHTELGSKVIREEHIEGAATALSVMYGVGMAGVVDDLKRSIRSITS